MIQKKFSRAVLRQHLIQQIAQTLGSAVSEQELSSNFTHVEFLEPSPGKLFWQSANAVAGVYIIVEGKVRLIDSNDNLIVSLEAGMSFGELTLLGASSFGRNTQIASKPLR